ncbi:MAG TPA: Mur ligase family protein, partial [Smithella sp.]|nr:Mur ligase family protein [Smithella sp.]
MKNSRTSQYLDSLNINKMRFGLGAITSVLSRLGHPQKSFKAVTITGTNGKGSTAAMIAAMLHKAGYCVGLYTSPHLIDVRERITVNGRKISRKDFDRIIVCVRKKVVQPLTYFEFITAVAFEYFKTRKADIAVLEVGLGGRLDATNVCRPLVSVITNIAFDHTAYLGRTLTSIAVEKAGIIKPHGLCVTGVAQKKILGLLQDICLQRGASLYRLNHDFRLARQKNGSLLYEGVYSDVKNLTVPLRGEHQLANAALALAAVEMCARKGFPVSETAVRAGLQNVRWEGRLEVL